MHSFAAKIAAAWDAERWRDVTVLVAVSGGADSVALLRALVETRGAGEGRLLAAHVNHGLRGDAADADEQFVAALCQSLDVSCHVLRVPREEFSAPRDGLEAAMRDARYRLLNETAHACGARYLVTAHTVDDQAETVLHHALRGTGLAGLGGMSPFRALSDAVTLARPMLGVRRRDVISYLNELGQSWREDATNADERFTRNRIRRDLLPKLAEEYNDDVVGALSRLAEQARDAQAIVASAAEALLSRAVTTSGNEAFVDCNSLVDAKRHVVRAMFSTLWRARKWPRQAMGFAEWDQLAELATTPDDTRRVVVFPGAVQAAREGQRLMLRKLGNET